MNKTQYIDSFNELKFTPNLESKVLGHILSDNILISQQPKKNIHVFRYTVIASCLCIILVFIGMNLFTPKLSCDLLSDESLSTLNGVKEIKKVPIEADEKKFIVDSQGVQNSEMIILENNETLKVGDNMNFKGTLLGNDIDCEIGYILNGNYQKINDVTNNDIELSFKAPETGTYYWCFVNYSDKEVKLSGSLTMSSNDLIYRNYGTDVIEADTNTVFIIPNLVSILESYEIEGIYALNRETSTLYKISSEITGIEYRIQEKGYYEVYAQTKDGNLIILNKYITTEVDSPNNESIIGL